MSSSKVLSISIPTWNRAELLRDSLSELTRFIRELKLEQEIEVLVSNNNSDDNTEDIVRDFQKEYPFIIYNRNNSNIGAKNNVLKSMYLAQGKYVLFMGDDDRIRKNAIVEVLNFIEDHKDAGVIIDTGSSKKEKIAGSIDISSLLINYYWYLGNAALFVIQTKFIKHYIDKFGYEFFNECWPQTQIMILALFDNPDQKCYLMNLRIPAESAHCDVMVYNSFYLWRTCYYELTNSIDSISHLIDSKIVSAAKTYLKSSLVQQFFNMLQCGVFVDEPALREKTRKHIWKNLKLFSAYERLFLITIVFALVLPSFISKSISYLAIFLLRGKKGLTKKNDFVVKELLKKSKLNQSNSGSIRTLEFELDNY